MASVFSSVKWGECGTLYSKLKQTPPLSPFTTPLQQTWESLGCQGFQGAWKDAEVTWLPKVERNGCPFERKLVCGKR